ncbi:MAG: hypothetical protein FWC02_01400 [Firmicutes bacterium]|nr:hypothetical protein [Bacillota bacterium]
MENNDFMRTIEVNGVKVEIDLRTARKIDTFKVGDNVKILRKDYDTHKVYSGVIVDFVAFKENPAIVVAYFSDSYAGVEIKFETITQDSNHIEIAACLPHELTINKNRVVDKFNIAIEQKKREADELQQKKDYFIKNFSKFFEEDKGGIEND